MSVLFVLQGKTASTNTGPVTAYKGVNYLYFETSNGNVGSIARLVSRGFIFGKSIAFFVSFQTNDLKMKFPFEICFQNIQYSGIWEQNKSSFVLYNY